MLELHWVCLPLSPPPFLPPLPFPRQHDQPLIFLPLLILFNMKTRVKTFMMNHFHLMDSEQSSCFTVKKLVVYATSVFMWKSDDYTARIVWDVFVSFSSSSSLPKYSSCRTLCVSLVWKWIAYPYIGMKLVIFNTVQKLCVSSLFYNLLSKTYITIHYALSH